MKTAIIHDWLVSSGGAERVLEALCEIFPDAPVYTSVCDRSKISAALQKKDIRTSFLQKIPGSTKIYRDLLPLMPPAFQSFRLKGFDLILSSSHACAKGVRRPKGSVHICYCHTPMRYAWDMMEDYLKYEQMNPVKKAAVPFLLGLVRRWDRWNSKGVDHFIANSDFVSRRIMTCYGRGSKVIHPPVDISKYRVGEKPGAYFLAVSRLVPQKRTDIIIEAFNRLGFPLKVIGTGRELERLKSIAGTNIELTGFVPEEDLAETLSGCRALIFASYEDFGLVPLEAQASGRPAIVYGRGGASETIIPGKTGIIFEEQTPEAVIEAVRKFETMMFDSAAIRRHAEGFDKEIFKQKIMEFIEERI